MAAAANAATPQYQIFDLGVTQVGDTASQGFGASPGGVAVGRSVRSNASQAFRWTVGGGLVGLPNLAGRNHAVSNDANDNGIVVGTAATTLFGSSRLPVIWNNGAVSQLPLPAGETLGDANGVNASGIAVGSVNGGSSQRAVIYNGANATVITQTTPTGCFMVTAFGINDSGLIVGQGIDPNNAARNVGMVKLASPFAFEVGALPGANGAIAFAVSNGGHVVGSSMMNQGAGLPFIWTQATGMVAIPLAAGTSQGSARGVNSAGWVVGQDSSAFSIPFLWDGTTTYRLADLLPAGSGWDLDMNTSSSALGISDSEMIVGTGVHNGETHAYAMVPVPGPATHFQVVAPTSCIRFMPCSFTVTARDQFNNTVTGYAGTVHFTSSDGMAELPADGPLTNGTGSRSVTFHNEGPQTVTATDTVTPSITGTSNPISVFHIDPTATPSLTPSPTPTPTPTPGPATHFTFTTPQFAVSGEPFNFTVTARDSANNIATGYAGLVHFTSTDPAATLPANSTLTNGVGTFQATLHGPVERTITATDTINSSITGTSNPIPVVIGDPTPTPIPSPSPTPTPFCVNDTWSPTTTTGAPIGRFNHTAVWTGSEMIVWGGFVSPGPVFTNTGGRYNPVTNSWTATGTTNAPSARDGHTAVWTGTEMIVWGGTPATTSGGRYNPSTNTWTATSTVNVPASRSGHTAVWTGSEMIIWGGSASGGAKYNPSTDTWTPINNTINVPADRSGHTAVWTGTEMIIWGGTAGGSPVGAGAKYNPSTDTWTPTSTVNAPADRSGHSAIWTGSEMIVWGGGNGLPNTGGRYNPNTDSWTATSITNAPVARNGHSAVWTGIEMIIWGGVPNSAGCLLTDGGRYNPNLDNWTPTETTNAPQGRNLQAEVWTGHQMIVWGGVAGDTPCPNSVWPSAPSFLNSGGRYCAESGPTPSPTPTPTPTASPGPATHFQVVAPGFAVSGDPFNFTVTAKDSANNTATGYTGSVHFTSSDPSAALPADSTLTNGTGTFQATLNQGGNRTITATDTVNSSITGTSNPISVIFGDPTPTPTPTPTATATPAITPTPTPGSSPAQALNLATRLRVQAGDNVGIGGFIITGNAAKTVAIRGIGPSLAAFGVSDFLADPTLELRNSSGLLLESNDNWQDDPADAAQLVAHGLALQDLKESGIVATLQPGASYTAILAGKNQTAGVGLIEIYDIDQTAGSELANISTRGFVLTGNNVMIGGFILGGDNNTRIVVRGIGPSLAQFGLNPVLTDPTLELHDGNGATLISNNDWQDDSASAAQLISFGLAPQNAKESAIATSLPPGAFTGILAGNNGGTGIGLIEIYNVH